ncbi:ubiquitin carboxyl-terminal hydrolase 45 isoform X3 [Pygocentrus nattereri]|uniref:Ubiquitin carboxyl-terminal hydrolase n=1 Tax=Pygocentrus nattereri TaxID=42514 RepID=A0AAR2IWZ3_PYGNA|nr:ubiquitin carboxyl-terminal hydrolase 45 isoform X3 [Pygocentrus nattereri]
MRLKDPFSIKTTDMTKRTNKPKKARDEESSDEVSAGLTCQHVSKAVELNSVKKAVTGSLWSVCLDCMKERDVLEMEQVGTHDIRVCLKCGFQGCSQSESQHSVKHQQAHHSDSHCISISLSTWKAWCFECNEELSTHCNKKALAQTLDFLQKHSAKSASGTSKIIKLLEEPAEYADTQRRRSPVNSNLIPVKGITNLGNTCFFNAVMQNLSQTHMLNDLIQEVKDKGHKLKICPPPETNLGPLTVTLSGPEPLTSAMFLFLHSMKEPGKGPVSPKILFSQLCQKAPRFKGYQQQDSQELLHYLLDSVRVEESKRIKAAILKAFNNPTEKTADEETKRQVKAYGKEGVKMNFVDQIFVGELTNTIMCEECEHISTVKEAFIDISLPIIEERISKPTNPGRLGRTGRDQEALGCHGDEPSAPHPQANKNSRRPSGQKLQGRRSSTCHDERGPESPQKQEEDTCLVGRGLASCQVDTAASQSDASEKNSSPQDSSNDADSEASESECSPRVPMGIGQSSTGSKASSSANTSSHSPVPFFKQSPTSSSTHNSVRSQQGGAVEQLVSAVSKLGLVHTPLDSLPLNHGTETPADREKERVSHQGAFQALSHSYTPASKECSVQSCLHQFTSVELLMGNNKLLCENCTERRHRQLRKSGAADKKTEKVYTSARKQMLISVLPPVVTLHLKRFHQAGMNLRKVNRHVDFPLILDLAPFCSASCKNLRSGERVLYSLYGIVEHSGSMRGGHYTAYVKVRTPQRTSEQRRNQSGPREAVSAPPGQWVYVSDTSVQTVPESRVLNSQAYLLFYEELL